MASKFAAWLRVKPAPTTVNVSNAVFKHLKKQGRLITFIRKPTSPEQDEAYYYTVFAHEPPSLITEFAVSVYHDLQKPEDADPFNIRGLRDRKPNPDPLELQCKLEPVPKQEMEREAEWINQQSPYRGSYFIDYKNQSKKLNDLYENIGAPPGVARSVGDWTRIPGQKPAPPPPENEGGKVRRLKMHALMEGWREAQRAGSDGQKKGNT